MASLRTFLVQPEGARLQWGHWMWGFTVGQEQTYGSSFAGGQLSLLLAELRKLFFTEKDMLGKIKGEKQ